MIEYEKKNMKDVKIDDLVPGDIFMTASKTFAFVRVKKGLKNIVATNIETEKDYNIRINDLLTKKVIGKIKKKYEI